MDTEKRTNPIGKRHLWFGGILIMALIVAGLGGLFDQQAARAQQSEKNQPPIFPPSAPNAEKNSPSDLPGPIPGMMGDVSGGGLSDSAEHILTLLERPSNLQISSDALNELSERLEKVPQMPVKLAKDSGAPLSIVN